MRALIAAQTTPWALEEGAYRQLLEVAGREKLSPEDTAVKLEALAAKLGRPLNDTQETYVRDGVAVVPVVGPIFRYANFFTYISGGTTAEDLSKDFTTALEDPSVRAIILELNSPGGEVAGINELSKMISAAREVKPIATYVGGAAQSGGYWIGSAAGEIVVDETALLGSIGVVMGVRDTSERDSKSDVKNIEIVSSQSPFKRVDVSTDAGRAVYQDTVNSLGAVFVDAVAANRGVSAEKVLADFGQGKSLVGADAVAAGMADRVGTLEGLIAEMSAKGNNFGGNPAGKGRTMSKENNPALAHTVEELATARTEGHAAGRTEGVAVGRTEERTRIAAIFAHPEAAGREQLAKAFAFESEMTPEAVGKMLAASPKAAAGAPNAFANAMAGVPNPPVGAGSGESADDEAALVKSISSYAPKR